MIWPGLGVTLDYLVEDSPEPGPDQHLVTVTEEEMMILKIVRGSGRTWRSIGC